MAPAWALTAAWVSAIPSPPSSPPASGAPTAASPTAPYAPASHRALTLTLTLSLWERGTEQIFLPLPLAGANLAAVKWNQRLVRFAFDDGPPRAGGSGLETATAYWESRGFRCATTGTDRILGRRGNWIGNLFSFDVRRLVCDL